MTRMDRLFSAIGKDRRGAAAIEFALLGPTLILMMMGVLMVGTHMQAYNAVRGVASDINRYTMVEYQKENELNKNEIQLMANSIARRSPYNLSVDRLDVVVTEESTSITGAKMFKVVLSYTPHEITSLVKVGSPTVTQSKTIFVPE